MTTRIKMLIEGVIAYGPQRVTIGQIIDVPDDNEANALVAAGLAVVDGTDAVTSGPLIDGGTPAQGDPNGEVEQESVTG